MQLSESVMSQGEGIVRYNDPAGGWGALKALGERLVEQHIERLVEQHIPAKGAATLLRMNQPQGFDCPGCAWPDPKHTSSFEFCENGGKAVAWESTEIDIQATGPQSVTVEDSMSMVHASTGMNAPASQHLKSEPAIVAGMARATLGNRSVDWEGLVADYDRIRDDIEAVFPIFQGYNARICVPGGFHLTSTARERIWATPTGKANFLAYDGLCEDPDPDDSAILWLTSVRSHDQYNSTLYSLSDRYRGVFGRRDVLFICAEEIEKRGFKPGDRVDLITASSDGLARRVSNFELVSYPFPARSCAAYYPEVNPLVPLHAYDPMSFTPLYKGIPIRIVAAGSETQAA
jgi:anaerobic selenocysteine-containing dehydrogenase